jgi:hypothetical protein
VLVGHRAGLGELHCGCAVSVRWASSGWSCNGRFVLHMRQPMRYRRTNIHLLAGNGVSHCLPYSTINSVVQLVRVVVQLQGGCAAVRGTSTLGREEYQRAGGV